MSNPGMGVMLGMLGGNEETVAAVMACINKVIASVEIKDDQLAMTFDDGLKVSFFDDGQSCCEHRYMVCDDKLDEYKDATFLGGSIKEAPSEDDEYGNCHEVQFLEISTSKGPLTVATHNEHNGNYGGFWIVARIGYAQ
jgi:hypothetical protein